MNRRSTSVSGWVNFPVADLTWKNSNEGGMFVKLVVVDNREFEQLEGECCGCDVFDTLTEVLVGDDQRPQPAVPEAYETIADVQEQEDKHNEWMRYHFPSYRDPKTDAFRQEMSAPYQAVILMGSTGWSGYSQELGQYWHCTKDALTAEGKALFDMVQARFPACTLHLLTFVDT